MDISEPCLEANNDFAIHREPEVARLNRTGVNWPDGNLVNAGSKSRLEVVRRPGARVWPESVIKPWAGIGQTVRNQPVNVLNGSLHQDRGRMMSTNRRIMRVRRGMADDFYRPLALVANRKIDVATPVIPLAPHRDESSVSLCEIPRHVLPACIIHKGRHSLTKQ